jgi:hypothetical protein
VRPSATIRAKNGWMAGQSSGVASRMITVGTLCGPSGPIRLAFRA